MGPIVFPCMHSVGLLAGFVLLAKAGLCGWEVRHGKEYTPLFC